MATFYYNRFSQDSYKSQWQNYIQNQSFADNITKSVGQQTKDFSSIISANAIGIQESINSASTEQRLAIEESTKVICGTLNSGFESISNNLNEIAFGIENVRNELNEIASMLDWNFSLVIEQQKISNLLLGNIAILLRIPDIQKERQYYIEQGLKFLKNAFFDNDMYEDALNNLTKAESIENTDYFTLHRIGLIYLYSPKQLDLEKAEAYFTKAAKYAIVETNENACISKNDLNENTNRIEEIKLQAAESYLFAARCCYIQGKFEEAANLASKSYQLVPELVEAGFTQAKALACIDKPSHAAIVLKSVIERDRYYSVKAVSDFDLCSKTEIKILFNEIRDIAVSQLQRKITELKELLNKQTEYKFVIDDLENRCNQNTYLDALAGLDIIETEYKWTISNFLYKNFSYPSVSIYHPSHDSKEPEIGFNNKNEMYILEKNYKNGHVKSNISLFDCAINKKCKEFESYYLFDCLFDEHDDLVCITKKDHNSKELDAYNITRETHIPILQSIKPDYFYGNDIQHKVYLSRDGKFIGCEIYSDYILIWEFSSGELLCKYPKDKFKNHPDYPDISGYALVSLAFERFYNDKYNQTCSEAWYGKYSNGKQLEIKNKNQIWDIKSNKLVKTLEDRYSWVQISENGLYVVACTNNKAHIMYEVWFWKNNIIAPKEDFVGTLKSFIKVENENFENIRLHEGEVKNMKIENERNIKANELISKAQKEETQQNLKWFGKNYSEAIRLYQMAAELGNEIAIQKVEELSK